MLLHHLINHPDATPTTLTACYHLGVRNNIQMAVDAVMHPNAPAEIVAAAAESTEPKLRIAWMTRDERTTSEIVEALKTERRGDVLATMVPYVADNPTLVDALAGLNKRPVALALITHATTFSDETLDHLLQTIDPAIAKLPKHQQTTVHTFYDKHHDAILRNATTLRSTEAMFAITSHPAADARTLLDVIDKTLNSDDPTYNGNSWRTENLRYTLMMNIISHPNVTAHIFDQLTVSAKRQNNAGELTTLQARRDRLDEIENHETNRDVVRTQNDFTTIVDLLLKTNNDHLHAELVVAALHNPNIEPYLNAPSFKAHVYRAITDQPDDPVATTVAERYGDDALATILTNGHRTDKLAAANAALNPEQVKQHVVIQRMKAQRLTLDDAVESGHIDHTNIGTAPIGAYLHMYWHHGAQTLKLVEHHIAGRLDGNLAAWEMFNNLSETYPGSIDELLDTTLAATTS